MQIYLDNAATSYPKPKEVYNEVLNYMTNIGSNPGRGGYTSSIEGSKIIYKTREALADFFNYEKSENVIFMPNVTFALNILIKGAVKKGCHVITTSMEHNSVLRPLNSLKQNMAFDLDILQCSEEGLLNVDEFKSKIKDNTKLVILSQASNVIGTIQPIEEIGQICKNNNIHLIIDAAQSAGSIPVDFKKFNCSAIAFTGHKGLLGPQGSGGFIIDDAFNAEINTYFEGGTGSLSQSLLQPDFLPDKFESGTLNAPAIAGLYEGINYINKLGLDYIREKEDHLTKLFLDTLKNMNDIKIYGLKEVKNRTSVISINSSRISNAELGFILDHEFGIMARTGFHCAPLAHKTIGTLSEGTLRFSIGPFNDTKDIQYTIDSLHNILKGM